MAPPRWPRAATTASPCRYRRQADTQKGRCARGKPRVIWHSQEMRRLRVAERILPPMTPPP